MENLQVTLRIDKDYGLVASFNCLYDIELQVVSLACTSRPRDQHVPFEVTQREKDWLFLVAPNRVKSRHAAGIAWPSFAPRNQLALSLGCQYFIGTFRTP